MSTSLLLRAGLAVFAAGVGVYYFGGEEYRVPAVVIQVGGALLLFVNAARQRREVAESDEPDG
ncbi:MAG: hypothetical protein P8R42_10565 [Candidatus Binatia bacterium]|nr:hypothetical protein [Candidatus Binatia bacterium]